MFDEFKKAIVDAAAERRQILDGIARIEGLLKGGYAPVVAPVDEPVDIEEEPTEATPAEPAKKLDPVAIMGGLKRAGLKATDISGSERNTELVNARVGEWRESKVNGIRYRKLQDAGAPGNPETNRHAYSSVQFYSASGEYGLSNSPRTRRVWKLRDGTSSVHTFPKHAVHHPFEDAVVGFNVNNHHFEKYSLTGKLISSSKRDMRLSLPGDKWSIMGTQGNVTEAGLVVFHPDRVANGKYSLVVVDVTDFTHHVIDLSKFELAGFTGSKTGYTINHASLHPNGLIIAIRVNGNRSQKQSDRQHILQRDSLSSENWRAVGYVEGGHGDFGYDEHGNAVWVAIGHSHLGEIPYDGKDAGSGAYSYRLYDDTGKRTSSTPIPGRILQGKVDHNPSVRFDNSPYSFSGHCSGHASKLRPGVFIASIDEASSPDPIVMFSHDDVNLSHHIDNLPVNSKNYYDQAQVSISRDGLRAVAAYDGNANQNKTPGLFEMDLSQCYEAA